MVNMLVKICNKNDHVLRITLNYRDKGQRMTAATWKGEMEEEHMRVGSMKEHTFSGNAY